MLDTLSNPILPIFSILIVGYIFFKIKLFDVSTAQAINKFVFYVATPALVFTVVSSAPITSLDYNALFVYFISQLLVYGCTFIILHFLIKLEKKEALLLGLTTVFVNHIFFVLPIAERVYGPVAALPIAGMVISDIIILFCGSIFALDLMNSSKKSFTSVIFMLCKNPFLIAAFLGVCSWFINSSMPQGVVTYAKFAGASAAPVSLFSLGVVLASISIGRIEKAVWIVVLINIVVVPTLVLGLSQIIVITPSWQSIVLLMAAGPCGAMPFIIALQYRIRTELIAKAILISTIFSLVSLTLITSH